MHFLRLRTVFEPPLEGKDAYFERSMEASKPKGQCAVANPPTEEDIRRHILIHGN